MTNAVSATEERKDKLAAFFSDFSGVELGFEQNHSFRIVFEHLVPFGFQKVQGGYDYRELILAGAFEVRVYVATDGAVSTQVIDTDLNEEYLSLHVTQARGSFVGQVRAAYLAVLERVAEACFEALPFRSPQANRLAQYLQATYGDRYDHPFEKSPAVSSYRYPQNHKWYALMMPVTRGKLDLQAETWSKAALEELLEIVNLKVNAKELAHVLKNRGIYPAYHMSKKSWVSIVLDETVSDELLFSLVENSRALVAGKSLRSLSEPDYWIIPANLKYYDIDAEFAANAIIKWTQKASIKTGDYVAIYITAPTRALRYLCRVLESDIPNNGYRAEKSIQKLMKLELLQTFPDSQFPSAVLKACGVTNIRGPRRMTEDLVKLLVI